ncbi:serine carboxypeptidase-like protein 50, partial [Tanacetum coccineum]
QVQRGLCFHQRDREGDQQSTVNLHDMFKDGNSINVLVFGASHLVPADQDINSQALMDVMLWQVHCDLDRTSINDDSYATTNLTKYGQLARYVQRYGNSINVLVFGASHLVPADQDINSQALMDVMFAKYSQLARYVQRYGNSINVLVFGASHLVPADQDINLQALIED